MRKNLACIKATYLLTIYSGIEVTTGPLGQGFSNAVGLAMAQAHIGAVYNKDGFNLINNFTYGNPMQQFHEGGDG